MVLSARRFKLGQSDLPRKSWGKRTMVNSLEFFHCLILIDKNPIIVTFCLMECWKQAGKFQLCCIELMTKAVLQGQTLVMIRIWEFVSKCSCTVFLSVGMLSRKNSLNGICWKTPGAVNTPATFLPLATLHSTPPQGQQCECYCRTQHVHPSLWTSAVL